MDIRQSYDIWSRQYDIDHNKTRDLEAFSLQKMLSGFTFKNCLEIGCGTGKNTCFLLSKSDKVTAVDFSGEMLKVAKGKLKSDKVKFVQADITEQWNFADGRFDLITFSLVLEHVENLNFIFSEVSKFLIPGGLLYIGELHPFRQYRGSKARFETAEGTQVLTCFTHHISDFVAASKNYGFKILDIDEFFDENNGNALPRVFSLLLEKP